MAEPTPHPPPAALERTSSLPQLESVPSPPRSLPITSLTSSTASTPSTAALLSPGPTSAPNSTPTPPSTSASVPVLHNELPRSFSGSILQSLEHLGVSAYSTAEVEQTVIARALQVEAEAQQARPPPSSRRPPTSPKRKRIPKKVGTSIASASSPLPIPLPIVHHDDPVTAAGSMAKKRLEDALAIRPPKDRTAPARRARKADDEEGEREGGTDMDEAPAVRSERQRLIDTGEATPFNGMAGVERGFRRVSRPQQLQTVTPPTTQRGERKERGERKDSRPPSATPTRGKARVRSATPTLKPPRPTSTRATLSVTPPPDNGRSSSPSSQGSARSEQPPSPALSVSELPARLTRARVKEEIKSIERAFKQKDREERGVKEEGVAMRDEDSNDGVRMMEEEEDEEEKGENDAQGEKESDEEWKGDEESSEEEVVELTDASDEDHRPRRPSRRQRRLPTRRRLMKTDDGDADEADTAEEADVGMLDDDDDGDVVDGSEGGGGGIGSGRGRLIDDFFDLDYEERIHAMRHSKVFANEVRRVEGREEAKEGEDGSDSLDVAFDGGYVLPGRIWDRLFGYQKTSVKWMWELHRYNSTHFIPSALPALVPHPHLMLHWCLHVMAVKTREASSQMRWDWVRKSRSASPSSLSPHPCHVLMGCSLFVCFGRFPQVRPSSWSLSLLASTTVRLFQRPTLPPRPPSHRPPPSCYLPPSSSLPLPF